jgi:phage tail-like protein
MSVQLRAYKFATDAQWKACLQVQVDPAALQRGQGIAPFAPLSLTPVLHKSAGAFAPVVTRTGDILWRDGDRWLHRLSLGEQRAETLRAPIDLGCAFRIVSTIRGLWVLGGGEDKTISRYEVESLTRVQDVELPGIDPIDIAAAERGSLWVLTAGGEHPEAHRLDLAGHVREVVKLVGPQSALALVFLRRSKRFVLLGEDRAGHQRLYWFAKSGGVALFSLPVAPMHLGFTAGVLGSDSSDRLFLGGRDSDECCHQAAVIVLDADGDVLMVLPIDAADAPVQGVVAARGDVLVAGTRGLLQYTESAAVPDSASQVRCSIVTPVLFSPDREDGRRWLRVEAASQLPEGTTIEIAVASTDDMAIRDRLKDIADDASKPASERARRLLHEPELWRPIGTFYGGAASVGDTHAPFAAKLYQVRDRFLWLSVTVTAAPGAQLPRLTALTVLYPGRTLMEHLPSIYQREESRPDGFLRNFIGVLETTTQGIDARIASMGSLISPDTAPVPWLDFIARWLGVPWDDALSAAQKRALIHRAAELARLRGTRSGLEALLESLLPGTPRRFRVIDATADFGFAMVGGPSCQGSALPALLGGRTRWAAELDTRAVLGYMRLPCDGQLDDGVYQLAGRLQIEIAATAAERKAWEPWMPALIAEMVPLNVRVRLRWVTERALRSDRLDGTLALEDEPTAHLGTDAITGLARLPERAARLSSFGIPLTTRLH